MSTIYRNNSYYANHFHFYLFRRNSRKNQKTSFGDRFIIKETKLIKITSILVGQPSEMGSKVLLSFVITIFLMIGTVNLSTKSDGR